MGLDPGTRLGTYEILSPLGAGGMGEVYRARDGKLDRDVAIKVLPESLARDPAMLTRFEREAKAVAALSHPNILAIFDFGVHDGVMFTVTELLEGRTLRERLDAARVSQRDALDLALQIARGLSAAHAKGIVHRDLKPENLFVTQGGQLKILDFGLARRGAEPPSDALPTQVTVSQRTEPGTLLGTVGYMAPEQVRGQTVDHRADIFACGAILYEMLAGRRAFEGETAADRMSAVLREEPPELSRSGRRIPPVLDRIVRRCLAKDREDRFQAARDLEFALEELASGAVAGMRPPAAETRSIAVLPFANMSAAPDTDYFSDGMTEEIINALAQLPELRVVARTSSFAFKGRNEDLRSVAERLGVEMILEGSVRRAGTRLRITAQLIDADGGHHLWSERYDREVSDAFAIQDEIAQAIAARLKVELGGEGRPRHAGPPTRDPEAYDLYLQGRHLFNRRAASEAIAKFEAAIARDPGFGPAYTGLADSYGVQAFYGGIDTRVAYARARAAAQRARELSPEAFEVHIAMALVEHYFGWNFRSEERELDQALSSGSAVPYYWKALLHGLRGQLDGALALAREAARLDPLSPYAVSVPGWPLITARRFEEARAAFASGLAIEPEAILPLYGLARCEAALGDTARSVATAERLVGLAERSFSWANGLLAYAYACAGRVEEARGLLAELQARAAREYVAPTHYAAALSALGDADATLSACERALAERNALAWWWILYDPALDPVRADPRYASLAERTRAACVE